MWTVELRHAHIRLALHCLREDRGLPLLLLHGLGESTPSTVPADCDSWPGPVWGLDFTGHGSSQVPAGGGYTCEALLGDADAALGELGAVTIVGHGLGGYVALQLAGSRPEDVRGIVIADGPGLPGGGPVPAGGTIVTPDPGARRAAGTVPDRFAMSELNRDVRPPDYATVFVRQAVQRSGLAAPVVVAARQRAPWLDAVIDEFGVRRATTQAALEMFAEGT